ncbi:universal stress protein [Streptomyces sp. NPDC004050]
MSRSVVAWLDEPAESEDAVGWAAQEARLRGLPLSVVHFQNDAARATRRTPLLAAGVAPRHPEGPAASHSPARVGEQLADLLFRVRAAFPGVHVTHLESGGRPLAGLLSVAPDAAAFVMSTRTATPLGGSPGPRHSAAALLAQVRCPLVVVPTRRHDDGWAETAAGGHGEAYDRRDVVLGLDLSRPDDAVIGYGFEAAASRGSALRVIYGWSARATMPAGRPADASFGEPGALSGVLRPWQEAFPTVAVLPECVIGRPVDHLVESSARALLVVVGHRVRSRATAPQPGPVVRGLLHRSLVPVAIVPHS